MVDMALELESEKGQLHIQVQRLNGLKAKGI